MNDNDLRNNNDNNVYKATTNLNTAIENPDVNINSATGVNMVSANAYDNQFNNNFNIQNNVIDPVNMYNQEVDGLNNANVVNQDFIVGNNNVLGNDSVIDSVNVNTNQFIPNTDGDINKVQFDNSNNIDNNSISTYQVDENAKYEPTIQVKKKPKRTSVLSNEVKAMIIIIFVLLLVVYVIPYIYDFFREMDLVITNR